MSQGLNSEGGTAIQLYSEHRDGTRNSAAGRFQRGQPSGSGSDTVEESLSWEKNRLSPLGEFIACLSMIVFDPLLVYLVVVNEDKRCLSYVKNQGIMIVLVLRSVTDFLVLKYFTFPMWIAFRKNKRNILKCSDFMIYVILNLPFPQVFMGIVLAQRRVENNSNNFVLKLLIFHITVQLLLRIVLVSGKAIPWTRGSKLFLPYIFCFSHVLGSFWYLFAVKAKIESWEKACKNPNDWLLHDLYNCNGDSLENFIPNRTTSNFGVFKEIFQYDILETTDVHRKLLFCFRWGFQSICSFGQNLQTNGEPIQDLLVIQVIMFSLFLFVSIIGIIQTNMQSDAVRVERRKLNVQHIRNSMLIRKLSKNLQRQVIVECKQSVWIATRSILGVDAVNLFNDHLPEDLKRMIKRELCLKLLKEVKEFGRWSEALLDELCDFVELVSYPKHTCIVREGGTIDAMHFLVEGKLQYHNFRNAKTGSRTITNYLRYGDFCGEELLAWFQADPYSSGLPISTKTIVALTNVVGFALMSDYLKSILIKHHAALCIQLYWQKRQAARPRQLSLRRRRNTQTYIQEQTPPAESFEISIENA